MTAKRSEAKIKVPSEAEKIASKDEDDSQDEAASQDEEISQD
jgi:hypothetical protein